MSDILDDLANEIKKSVQTPIAHRVQRPRERQGVVSPRETRSANFIKARGPGGLIMDFGHRTGNPFADGATDLLNQFADPVQASIVDYQAQAFNKALMEHVTGRQAVTEDEERASVVSGLVHAEWNKQLGKSFDQQTAEHVAKAGLGNGGDAMFVEGEFNKSTLIVGGDTAVAQSPTDAAVIEMMKREMATTDQGENDGSSR